jgi:hypothetical protein
LLLKRLFSHSRCIYILLPICQARIALRHWS